MFRDVQPSPPKPNFISASTARLQLQHSLPSVRKLLLISRRKLSVAGWYTFVPSAYMRFFFSVYLLDVLMKWSASQLLFCQTKLAKLIQVLSTGQVCSCLQYFFACQPLQLEWLWARGGHDYILFFPEKLVKEQKYACTLQKALSWCKLWLYLLSCVCWIGTHSPFVVDQCTPLYSKTM